ncbi:DMT family transporter [Brevibacillus centrosporus]|uniref:DMT family transporter n=1 Tax=Brevibacillus centrosporus TaxID=54910 RepID=UPI000F09D19B|nr:DMT family transporter [Brevibacillus centrosporus]MEC2130703.1 DMT family transporter [Brevibacillus centrosporus]MED4908206.1 DMT family transporter [Brevibacillus centrosporus]RNB69258.1 DMT family transporter [Brevibacillus centrosporus]GED32133.1 multidrug DMT transporter permease [Brevibacillus centrosporus]
MEGKRAWWLLVFCNLFWAGNYIFGKFVVTEMTPLWLTFARWVLALVVLIPLAIVLEKPDWRQVAKAWLPLTLMGLFGVIGFNVLLYSSLEHTSATNAALVTALNPVVIVLFSVFFLREKVSRIQATGFILSLFGVLVILTQGHVLRVFQTDYNQGDLLVLCCVLVWTLYSIIGKKVKGVSPITATAASTALAVVMMLPFAIAEGVDFSALSPLAFTGIAYIVLFPSICSFVFWNVSVRAVGASQAGITLNLIPVFTAMISVALGERISQSQVWGGLLVFIGVTFASGLIDQRWKRRQAKSSAEVMDR